MMISTSSAYTTAAATATVVDVDTNSVVADDHVRLKLMLALILPPLISHGYVKNLHRSGILTVKRRL